MRYRVAALSAALCAVLLLVAWVVRQGQSEGAAPREGVAPATTAWPTSSDVLTGGGAGIGAPWAPVPVVTELAATGIDLVNAPGVESMTVDGAGAVWLLSPWQLARVDPRTGAARMWDVSDDRVFATLRAIEPSAGNGVWLIESDRVRLFDGRRFVRDLPVPAEYRGGDGRRINSLVEVGSEVWVSSVAGVARSAGGPWAMVGDDTISGAAMLTVDATGRVWCISQELLPDGQLDQSVMRFDGTRWTAVDGPDTPPHFEEVVADPTAGVVVRSGGDVHRFDGLTWWRMPPLPPAAELGEPASRAMSMTPDGSLWVVGSSGLVRAGEGGPWESIARVDGPGLVGMGFTGSDVLVADPAGLLRLDGDRLARVWTAPGRGVGSGLDGLLAISSDEVWATGEGGVLQFVDGQWRERLKGRGWLGQSQLGWGRESGLARAADGTVWAIAGSALARFSGDEPEIIPRRRIDGWLVTGPDSGVWAVEAIWPGWSRWYAGEDPDGVSVTRVLADGTQAAVTLPGPPWSLTSVAAGADGSIWVTICEGEVADYCTAPSLMRWDGEWSVVPHPGADVAGATVAADGSLWALLTERAYDVPFVARYDTGAWTVFREVTNLAQLTANPAGGVCGVEPTASELVCIDASGQASRRSLPVPGRVHIGQDGSLWMEDSGVVARLPGTVRG